MCTRPCCLQLSLSQQSSVRSQPEIPQPLTVQHSTYCHSVCIFSVHIWMRCDRQPVVHGIQLAMCAGRENLRRLRGVSSPCVHCRQIQSGLAGVWQAVRLSAATMICCRDVADFRLPACRCYSVTLMPCMVVQVANCLPKVQGNGCVPLLGHMRMKNSVQVLVINAESTSDSTMFDMLFMPCHVSGINQDSRTVHIRFPRIS